MFSQMKSYLQQEVEKIKKEVYDKFIKKLGEKIVQKNIKALERGYNEINK